jgi:4-hydroxybenzoate polyprenyltransferase
MTTPTDSTSRETSASKASHWKAYWRLMRFDRPIGTLLLLWPTWWALL